MLFVYNNRIYHNVNLALYSLDLWQPVFFCVNATSIRNSWNKNFAYTKIVKNLYELRI